MAKLNDQELDKIHKLVQSTDQKNVAVGLEVLKSLPTNQQKLTYTFVLGFFHPESTVRRKVKAWFKKEAPKDFYDHFSKEINFTKIYGKIHNGYPHASKVLTPILEQVLARKVLDAQTLGKYMFDLWVGCWEFCCKHGIGDDVENLKRVQDNNTLYLSYTWPDFPKGLWRMHQVVDLKIVNYQVDTIPEEITSLANLKSLELYVAMHHFPEHILGLSQLQSLRLYNQDAHFYETFPADITKLSSLQELHLHSLPAIVPASVGTLIQLKVLTLSSFKETKLPEELVQLQNLTTIDLDYSRNLDWPNVFTQLAQLPHLKTIILSNCQVETLPKEIGLLTQVEHLDLSSCRIKKLPLDLLEMKSLKSINLERNSLDSIPTMLKQLPQLQEMNLYKYCSGYNPQEVKQQMAPIKIKA